MFHVYIADNEFTSRDGSCHQISPRHDPVRNDGIFRSVKTFHTFNNNGVAPCSAYLASHAVYKIRKVNDLGFLGCISYHSLSLCAGSGQHNILRRSYTGIVQMDIGPCQIRRFTYQIAVFFPDHDAQLFQTMQMQVDRTLPDVASSRISDHRSFHSGKHCAQHHDGRTDFPDIPVRNRPAVHFGRVHNQCFPFPFYPASYGAQYQQHGFHIHKTGEIMQDNRLIRQYDRCQNRKNGILCANNPDFSLQLFPTSNSVLIHSSSTSFLVLIHIALGFQNKSWFSIMICMEN